MTTAPLHQPDAQGVARLQLLARGVLRYSLVFLLLMWGSFKFAAFEAEAIKPLVENSPLLGWMLSVFGLRGTSAIFGVFEVSAAIAIILYKRIPRVSAYASLAAAGMFVVTLSFLFTTPNGFSGPFTGFLMKDVVLLGAALYTAAESFELAGWNFSR